MASAPPPSSSFKKSVAREYLESLVVAFILATFIRTFIVQAFKIPTGSMETNLLIGDHLLVNKVVYSPSLLPFEGALLAKKPIRRGHVVVFKYPEEPTRDFIKRVIGLPGETVEIRDKVVYIDGKPLDEPYKVHRNQVRGINIDQDDYPPTRIPEDSYFCMGDNRDNSRDSRSWGFVPASYLKGRAFMIWWSYEEDRDAWQQTAISDRLKGIWSKVAHLFTKSRWERTFQIIR